MPLFLIPYVDYQTKQFINQIAFYVFCILSQIQVRNGKLYCVR